jgi:hypothetical protein
MVKSGAIAGAGGFVPALADAVRATSETNPHNVLMFTALRDQLCPPAQALDVQCRHHERKVGVWAGG